MVRVATSEDIPALTRMAVAFNTGYYDVPLNMCKVHDSFKRCLDIGVVLVSHDGFIAGTVLDDPLHDWTALVELAWYAKTTGPRLLSAFIAYGKEAGVNEVRMTTLNTTPNGVDTFLKRSGFTLIEKSHRLLI